MRKRELLNLPTLRVTPEIRELAKADELIKRKYKCGEYGFATENYQRKMYLRCIVEAQILKVGIFFPDHIKTGSTLPNFEVFVSKKENTFLTYDRANGRWLTAKLDRIDSFPIYAHHRGERWISQADSDTIRDYLGMKEGGYDGLLQYQREIREAELVARHKKETDPWDEDLKQVPPLPKDWEQWAGRIGIPEHFIYYHYKKRGARVGYCTRCGKEVPIKNPRHNKNGRCPRCRHEITYKAVGRAGTVLTGRYAAYLLQRCRDGFVLRVFRIQRKHPNNGRYQDAEVFTHEVRRIIYDRQMQARAYDWGVYKQCEARWISGLPMEPSWYGNADGFVYGKTLPCLAKKELKQTGLIEWIQKQERVDPERFLEALRRTPQLEQITKAGLWRLAEECVRYRYDFQSNTRFHTSTSLTGMLGLHSQALGRLRQHNGGYLFLGWLQQEVKSGKPISDELLCWFCEQKLTVKSLQFILDRMSPQQIQNYLVRQGRVLKRSYDSIINTWADYLAMAKRLRMDVNDSIIYRVRKLKQRHDELVKICQERAPELRLMEMKEKYPGVDFICRGLKKYEYQGETYSVVAPTGIADILAEGDALHHCVSAQERYWERIEQRESYILFLRKNTALKKPY